MLDLPTLALSVRQPWAWAIIHGGKDIENRTQFAIQKGDMRRGHIAIHAGKGMTREEYLEGYECMRDRGVICPPPGALARGAIIGSVHVVDIVRQHASPWFFGPRGLVLRDPLPAARIVPALGELGYFTWREGDASIMPEPARWMLPQSAPAPGAAIATPEPDLFG